MQDDIFGVRLFGEDQAVGVGGEAEDVVLLMLVEHDEGGPLFADNFADADVVADQIGDLGVVVDGEDGGRAVQAFDYSKIIRHY